MSSDEDSADKSFEATQQKLEKARIKGEVPRSIDLLTAVAYGSLTVTLFAVGADMVGAFGTVMMSLIDQAETLAPLVVTDHGGSLMGGLFLESALALAPVFVVPPLAVLLVAVGSRTFLFTPEKLKLKLERVNPISNARNKFGRSGLFEFFKSFIKLVVYSACLAVLLINWMPDILSAVTGNPTLALQLLSELSLSFLLAAVLVAGCIGIIDVVWQKQEHMRKNRMSRKEIQDENKESEGDPHLKQERRQRAQVIAMTQMMSDVPKSDVIIVNPTHFAVALRWDRTPGSAPECVAKGVDQTALVIRLCASEHGVPIHSDPPTARALYSSVEIGCQIDPQHYRAVAAAIQFAEAMRKQAKKEELLMPGLHQLVIMIERDLILERRKLQPILDRESDLRSQLTKLADRERDTRVASKITPVHKSVGADLLWQAWLGRKRSELNTELAQVLAIKEARMGGLRKAHARQKVTEKLISAAKAKSIGKMRAAALVASIEMSLTRGQ